MNNIYPPTSPYYNTGIVKGEFLDVMVNRKIPKLAGDVYWTVTPTYEYRPDLLAHDLYGDSRLWWVFASRNPDRLTDPLFGFTAGTGMFLPKAETLKQALRT